MTRICFVCWGNICRSPAAEVIMQRMVDDAGLAGSIDVESRGTSDEHLGEPPDKRTMREAERRGLDLTEHRVKTLSRDDFEAFDLIVMADALNFRRVERLARTDDERAKLKLLRTFVPNLDEKVDQYGGDVPDPWYGGADDFVLAFDLIEEACEGLLEHVRQTKN